MLTYTVHILQRMNKKCPVCRKTILCKKGEEKATIYHVECLKSTIPFEKRYKP